VVRAAGVDNRGASGLIIGLPHVGICQRNPLAKLGSINLQGYKEKA